MVVAGGRSLSRKEAPPATPVRAGSVTVGGAFPPLEGSRSLQSRNAASNDANIFRARVRPSSATVLRSWRSKGVDAFLDVERFLARALARCFLDAADAARDELFFGRAREPFLDFALLGVFEAIYEQVLSMRPPADRG